MWFVSSAYGYNEADEVEYWIKSGESAYDSIRTIGVRCRTVGMRSPPQLPVVLDFEESVVFGSHPNVLERTLSH